MGLKLVQGVLLPGPVPVPGLWWERIEAACALHMTQTKMTLEVGAVH